MILSYNRFRKKRLEGRRPSYGLLELVRRWNDIHFLRQDALSEDGLSLRKMLLCNGQLIPCRRDDPLGRP